MAVRLQSVTFVCSVFNLLQSKCILGACSSLVILQISTMEDSLKRQQKVVERGIRVAAGLQLTKNEDGNGFSYLVHGFKYDDYSRAGLIHFPKLCKYFEAMRFSLGRNWALSDFSEYTIFMQGIQIDVSKELYQLASLTSEIRMRERLSHIGNTSFSAQVTMTDVKSGKVMASMLRNRVLVNFKTRKPVPLAPSFKQRAGGILGGSNMKVPQRFHMPSLNVETCYSCKIIVNMGDIDYLDHVSQNVYVHYAIECAARASASGYYKKLKGIIDDYCVKSASFAHLGESRAGDELLAMTCEDPSNSLLLYFIFRKEDKDICHAKIEYYDPLLTSHL